MSLSTLTATLASGLTLCTLLGCAGAWHWLLDLLSHFRLPYCVLLCPLVVLSVLRAWWATAAIALLGGLVNAALLLPYVPGPTRAMAAPGQASLRLLTHNVLVTNPHRHAVLTWALCHAGGPHRAQ